MPYPVQRIVYGFTKWKSDWEKPDIPKDVSGVFYNLYKFVEINYGSYNESYRYSVFSAAYCAYCGSKKERITKLRLNGEPEDSPVIKSLFREYDSYDYFKELCDTAEANVGSSVGEITRRSVEKAIKDNRSGWRDLGINLAATFIAAALVFFLPVLASFNNTTANETLNAFGRYLVCKFSTPNNDAEKNFCGLAKPKG